MHECWLGSLDICLGPRHCAGPVWQQPRAWICKGVMSGELFFALPDLFRYSDTFCYLHHMRVPAIAAS